VDAESVAKAGDTMTGLLTLSADPTSVLHAATKQYVDARAVPNCGKLAYSSTIALTFLPFGGDRIRINGVIYAIPSGGIVGLANTNVYVNGTAGQNLAASTAYYVYAFNNSGTITADFSTTTHATSATAGNIGTEIKSGDDTRSLIGMIRTNVSSQFQNDAAFRGVISWFNRRNIAIIGAALLAGSSSTSFAELGTGARIFFLTWSEEAVHIGIGGQAYGSVSGWNYNINVGINSTTTLAFVTDLVLVQHASTTNYSYPIGGFAAATVAEQFNYITPVWKVGGGGGTVNGTLAIYGMIRG
jgi:hypothetical protein